MIVDGVSYSIRVEEEVSFRSITSSLDPLNVIGADDDAEVPTNGKVTAVRRKLI